jgi:hypothetical protein
MHIDLRKLRSSCNPHRRQHKPQSLLLTSRTPLYASISLHRVKKTHPLSPELLHGCPNDPPILPTRTQLERPSSTAANPATSLRDVEAKTPNLQVTLHPPKPNLYLTTAPPAKFSHHCLYPKTPISTTHHPTPPPSQPTLTTPTPPRLETPSRTGDSPPPPPLPPKDEWHQSQPRYASLHSRSPSGISNLTSHTRSPSGISNLTSHTRSPSQFSQPPPQHSHSRSPSHLSEPPAPSPRRLSTEIRMSLPPLQTNMTPTPPAQNISAKNTSAESRKKRQRELEMGGSTGGARAGDEGEERILMSPTSYPGQGWAPGGWEQY